MSEAKDKLSSALAEHGVVLQREQVETLQRYCSVLWDLNQSLNLTRHTNYELFVSRDLLDSVRLSELLAEGESVLDVGSGGGVPGIVLAVLRPDLRITLSESVGKKSAALAEIVAQLDLPLTVVSGRAEDYLTDYSVETLVARAVGPLWKMLKWFEDRWGSIGRLLAVKGPRWVEERGEARHRGYFRDLQLRKLASYPMPGTDSESVILEIRPRQAGK